MPGVRATVRDGVKGVFTSVGVVPAQPPRVASVADLLCTVVDDLDAIAPTKGDIRQLLHDK